MTYIVYTRAQYDDAPGAVIVRESEDGPVIEVIDAFESEAAAKLEEARQKHASEQSRPLAKPAFDIDKVE